MEQGSLWVHSAISCCCKLLLMLNWILFATEYCRVLLLLYIEWVREALVPSPCSLYGFFFFFFFLSTCRSSSSYTATLSRCFLPWRSGTLSPLTDTSSCYFLLFVNTFNGHEANPFFKYFCTKLKRRFVNKVLTHSLTPCCYRLAMSSSLVEIQRDT